MLKIRKKNSGKIVFYYGGATIESDCCSLCVRENVFERMHGNHVVSWSWLLYLRFVKIVDEMIQNKAKQNKAKQNQTTQNKAKQNKTTQKETKLIKAKQNKTQQNRRKLNKTK